MSARELMATGEEEPRDPPQSIFLLVPSFYAIYGIHWAPYFSLPFVLWLSSGRAIITKEK